MAEEEIVLLSDEELASSFVGSAYSLYMKEVFSYPVLSSDENKELARRYKSGDFSAREKMIKGNLRLVVNVALKYKNRITHLQVLDVIQEGNLGLMRAIEDYNPEIGAFSTYAIWRIRQAITRSISNKEEEIRKPVNVQDKIVQYHRILEECKRNHSFVPDDEELCRVLDVGFETLDNIKTASKFKTVSMNQRVDADESTELGDFLSSDVDTYKDVEDRIVNRQLFLILKNVLSPLNYFVIYRRILDSYPSTLEEVAATFSITRERIRQIEETTLMKVKPYLEENSAKAGKVMQSIIKREGRLVEKLNTEPIHPLSIVKYVYIKDILSEEEKKVLHDLYFGKYALGDEQRAVFLGYSLEEYLQIRQSLAIKMQKKFVDMSSFKRFKDSMLKNYGTRIFDLNCDSDIHFIDYDLLKERYGSLSLEDMQELFCRYFESFHKDEVALLEKFFHKSVARKIPVDDLLKDINLTVFGYKEKGSTLPKEQLYKIYKKNLEDYTEEQRLFLECYFFGVRDKSEFVSLYSASALYYRYYYLIDRLERTYYNIYCYFENNFTKEEYLKFKSKFKNSFSAKRFELLDLFYGVDGPAHSIGEIATMYDEDYIKMHDMISDAREAAILLYSGFGNKLDIDKKLYRPFVDRPIYEFTPETREVLHMFLIDDCSYDEISQKMGITKYRVSNIITDGVRKIDNYRFGITPVLSITRKELLAFFQYYSDCFRKEEKKVLQLRHLKHMGNTEIAQQLGIDLEIVKRYVSHFSKLYYSYRIRDVSVQPEEIRAEVLKHPSESILKEKEKELASYSYGISCSYNPDGKVYTSQEICEKMHISIHVYHHIHQSVLESVKGYKIGIKRADYLYMGRDQLNEVLDDVHLPISSKEREIICSLFALKGYPQKSFAELSSIYGDTKGSLTRRYNRAMVSIFRYLRKEIPGQLHYEEDIVPNLKYFSLSERKLIVKYFKEGMTVQQIADEYHVTFNVVLTMVENIRVRLFDFLNNPKAKKFDFDYYLQVRHKPDLPFYGDIEKAIAVFDLFYGMVGDLRLSVPEIIKKLGLELNASAVNRAANNLMLSVCKYKDGIRKDCRFTYEEIREYYDKHSSEMVGAHKQSYLNYFKKFDNQHRINGISSGINYTIAYDLLLDTRDDVITLEMLDREYVLKLLKKYRKKLQASVRHELMALFAISERELMNGKDINHVYRILDKLYQLEYKDDFTYVLLKKD